MSFEFVISLDDPAAREAEVAGEKAAALARLRQHGLPVPGGFVIHADASAEAIAGLTTEIESRFASAGDAVRALEAASQSIRGLITELEVPPGLGNAISSAFDDLGNGAVVAVRSSGTAEDLPGASFAGQYDSFLNVTSGERLIERLVDVWASLYSAHAVSYRRHIGLPVTGVKMAVLVQEQLDASSSGVLFTRDPVSGVAGRMVVNAALGLGEGVVAGDVPSDNFTLDAGSLAVLERTVVAKTSMVVARPRGGIATVAAPEERRQAPALSDKQLTALGGLALKVRELEGGERDIEFAVVNGEVKLLQARPVTGIEDADDEAPGEFTVEWEDPEEQQYAWTLAAGFTDPRPVLRFEQDLRRVYARHSRLVFDDCGVPMARGHILTFAQGYAYARGPEVSGDEVRRRMQSHIALGREYLDRGTTYYEQAIEPEVLGLLEELGPFRRPAGESLAGRLAFLERTMEVYGHVNGDLHWRQLARPFDAPEWPQVFHQLTGLPEIEAGTLLQAIDNKTTRMVRRLRGLARIVQGDDKLRAAFAAREFDRLREAPLRARAATRQFRRRFSALLRDYGRRNGRSYGSATSFTTPTWNLDPTVPLRLVASYAQQDLDQLDQREQAARRERITAAAQARTATADRETRERFDAELKAAQLQVRFMENHNAIMEQGTAGVMREAIWWMGEALVRRGRLGSPDDALHLSVDELRAAADDDGDLRPLVREREAEFERRSRLSPPQLIGDGEPPRMPPGFGEQSMEDAGFDGTILRGTAASKGRYTGRARVYEPGGETPDVEAGDILVARNAGQDWTPILSLLGGIVLDEGAVFQHAALVAREYRIPAVIQTKEATAVISDGATITVDGTAGTVELTP